MTRTKIAVEVEVSEKVATIVPIRTDRNHSELPIARICANGFREETGQPRLTGPRIPGKDHERLRAKARVKSMQHCCIEVETTSTDIVLYFR